MRTGEHPGYRLPAGVLLAAVLGALLLVQAPPTTGAWLTSQGSAAVTFATRSCGDPTPYAVALQATTPAPELWWRFSEPAGSPSTADETGNGNTGTVVGTAATLGDPGVVECDPPKAGEPGGSLHLTAGAGPATGFVVQSGSAHTVPRQTAIAVWLRATPGTEGALAGFTDSGTGAAGRTDRVLALDPTGRVSFRVTTGWFAGTTTSVTTPPSGDPVTDGDPHLIVATIEPTDLGQAGPFDPYTITLYVDGAQVGTVSGVSLPFSFWRVSGWWRTGDGTSTPAVGAHLDELAVWEGGAPSATDITRLYDANHW